jgi:hypothetical protein
MFDDLTGPARVNDHVLTTPAGGVSVPMRAVARRREHDFSA